MIEEIRAVIERRKQAAKFKKERKAEQRKKQNRIAQQRFRDRQKANTYNANGKRL